MVPVPLRSSVNFETQCRLSYYTWSVEFGLFLKLGGSIFIYRICCFCWNSAEIILTGEINYRVRKGRREGLYHNWSVVPLFIFQLFFNSHCKLNLLLPVPYFQVERRPCVPFCALSILITKRLKTVQNWAAHFTASIYSYHTSVSSLKHQVLSRFLKIAVKFIFCVSSINYTTRILAFPFWSP